MTRKRHTAEQISAVLKDAQAGTGVQELCRKHGISDATFDKWRTKRWTSRRGKRSPQKTGSAQGDASGGAVEHRALGAESATGVPVTHTRAEHVALSQSTSGGCDLADPDPGDCRGQAAVRLSSDLCAGAPRRLGREP